MINRNLLSASLLFLLFSAGCVQSPPPELPAPPSTREQQLKAAETEKGPLSPDTGYTHLDEQKIRESESSRAQCYNLQPGRVTHHRKGPSAAASLRA